MSQPNQLSGGVPQFPLMVQSMPPLAQAAHFTQAISPLAQAAQLSQMPAPTAQAMFASLDVMGTILHLPLMAIH